MGTRAIYVGSPRMSGTLIDESPVTPPEQGAPPEQDAQSAPLAYLYYVYQIICNFTVAKDWADENLVDGDGQPLKTAEASKVPDRQRNFKQYKTGTVWIGRQGPDGGRQFRRLTFRSTHNVGINVMDGDNCSNSRVPWWMEESEMNKYIDEHHSTFLLKGAWSMVRNTSVGRKDWRGFANLGDDATIPVAMMLRYVCQVANTSQDAKLDLNEFARLVQAKEGVNPIFRWNFWHKQASPHAYLAPIWREDDDTPIKLKTPEVSFLCIFDSREELVESEDAIRPWPKQQAWIDDGHKS